MVCCHRDEGPELHRLLGTTCALQGRLITCPIGMILCKPVKAPACILTAQLMYTPHHRLHHVPLDSKGQAQDVAGKMLWVLHLVINQVHDGQCFF